MAMNWTSECPLRGLHYHSLGATAAPTIFQCGLPRGHGDEPLCPEPLGHYARDVAQSKTAHPRRDAEVLVV